jgi:hypothetical protein
VKGLNAMRESTENAQTAQGDAAGLRGSLSQSFKRCGKRPCRCVLGQQHGPYWRLYWRESGRKRKRYVRPGDLANVRAAIELWRKLHPPLRSFRDELAELRKLSKGLPS